jgi:exodeoxyribonuclease V alpha subunit
LYRAEQFIAAPLHALAATAPTWPAIDVVRAIPWVEQKTALILAESQRTVCATAADILTAGS